MAQRGWRDEADRLAAESLAAGDPTGWFERLWAAGRVGTVSMPWSGAGPHPLLVERGPAGTGRAVVTGCGSGDDAEHLAGLGWSVTGFDVAPSAVAAARDAHPGSAVDYAVADLFDVPAAWRGAFDLVTDIYTVQALPLDVRPRAIAAAAGLVAPGGTLLAICFATDERVLEGPPWPLTRGDVEGYTEHGLTLHSLDRLSGHWRAELRR